MLEALRYVLPQPSNGGKSWVETYYIDPNMFFHYEGFAWVSPLRPGWLLYGVFAGMALAGFMLVLGWFTRWAAAAACLLFTYLFLLDQSNYLNHYYLTCVVLGLLVLLPSNHAWSMDANLSGWQRETVPAWSVWAVRLLLGMVYVYAGIAKLNPDWLAGEPMRDWLGARTDKIPLLGQYFTEEWMVMLFSYGGLLLDLTVAFFLLWRPTRLVAFGFCVLFHLTNVALFSIGIFPWFMIGATTIFFSPGWPRRRPLPPPLPSARGPKPSPGWLIALVAVFLFIQFLLPLRPFMYPGNPSWTEEGHRLSWHMKLRHKHTKLLAFYATDPASGQRQEIVLSEWLTPRQQGKMLSRPYLLRQFARRIEPTIAEQTGWPDPAIHAHIRASLNSRAWQDYVLPDKDLTEVRWGLGHNSWTEPLLPKKTPSERPKSVAEFRNTFRRLFGLD